MTPERKARIDAKKAEVAGMEYLRDEAEKLAALWRAEVEAMEAAYADDPGGDDA